MAWCLVKHRDKFTFYLYLYYQNDEGAVDQAFYPNHCTCSAQESERRMSVCRAHYDGADYLTRPRIHFVSFEVTSIVQRALLTKMSTKVLNMCVCVRTPSYVISRDHTCTQLFSLLCS